MVRQIIIFFKYFCFPFWWSGCPLYLYPILTIPLHFLLPYIVAISFVYLLTFSSQFSAHIERCFAALCNRFATHKRLLSNCSISSALLCSSTAFVVSTEICSFNCSIFFVSSNFVAIYIVIKIFHTNCLLSQASNFHKTNMKEKVKPKKSFLVQIAYFHKQAISNIKNYGKTTFSGAFFILQDHSLFQAQNLAKGLQYHLGQNQAQNLAKGLLYRLGLFQAQYFAKGLQYLQDQLQVLLLCCF